MSHTSTLIVPDNYPDIQSAVDAARDGDKIHVRDGVYREKVLVNEKSNISIRASGNSVTLDGNSLSPPAAGFNLTGVSKVWIMGFKITGFDKGILVDGLSSNVTIAGNTIRDIRDDGVKVRSDNSRLVNNIINNCGDDALKINADNCSIINNAIYGNGEEGIEVHGNGNVLRMNTVKNNEGIGIEIWGSNNTVTDNIIKDNGNINISVNGTGNDVSSNNH